MASPWRSSVGFTTSTASPHRDRSPALPRQPPTRSSLPTAPRSVRPPPQLNASPASPSSPIAPRCATVDEPTRPTSPPPRPASSPHWLPSSPNCFPHLGGSDPHQHAPTSLARAPRFNSQHREPTSPASAPTPISRPNRNRRNSRGVSSNTNRGADSSPTNPLAMHYSLPAEWRRFREAVDAERSRRFHAFERRVLVDGWQRQSVLSRWRAAERALADEAEREAKRAARAMGIWRRKRGWRMWRERYVHRLDSIAAEDALVRLASRQLDLRYISSKFEQWKSMLAVAMAEWLAVQALCSRRVGRTLRRWATHTDATRQRVSKACMAPMLSRRSGLRRWHRWSVRCKCTAAAEATVRDALVRRRRARATRALRDAAMRHRLLAHAAVQVWRCRVAWGWRSWVGRLLQYVALQVEASQHAAAAQRRRLLVCWRGLVRATAWHRLLVRADSIVRLRALQTAWRDWRRMCALKADSRRQLSKALQRTALLKSGWDSWVCAHLRWRLREEERRMARRASSAARREYEEGVRQLLLTSEAPSRRAVEAPSRRAVEARSKRAVAKTQFEQVGGRQSQQADPYFDPYSNRLGTRLGPLANPSHSPVYTPVYTPLPTPLPTPPPLHELMDKLAMMRTLHRDEISDL